MVKIDQVMKVSLPPLLIVSLLYPVRPILPFDVIVTLDCPRPSFDHGRTVKGGCTVVEQNLAEWKHYSK